MYRPPLSGISLCGIYPLKYDRLITISSFPSLFTSPITGEVEIRPPDIILGHPLISEPSLLKIWIIPSFPVLVAAPAKTISKSLSSSKLPIAGVVRNDKISLFPKYIGHPGKIFPSLL